MELLIYPLLGTCSRRAIIKTRKRYGHRYTYTPRGTLIHRLAQQLNMTPEQIVEQIEKERNYLIRELLL